MRAVVHDSYGPPEVLRLAEVARPVPRDDEVLVRIHATTVSRTDCALRAGEPYFSRMITGLRRPRRRILGSDLAGVVEAVGTRVSEFHLPFSRCRDSLKRGGVYLATDGLRNLFLAVWTARVGARRVRFSIPPRFLKTDVLFLKGLVEAGEYRAVIDRRHPLEEVIEATRYVETRHKTGNVVLTLSADSAT